MNKKNIHSIWKKQELLAVYRDNRKKRREFTNSITEDSNIRMNKFKPAYFIVIFQ